MLLSCLLAMPLLVAAASDDALPTIRTQTSGPSLQLDFPDMRIGVAEYDDGPTGTTVFHFPKGVKGAIDVRGGAPGTVNATTLMNAYEARMVQAVVFSGGSWFGLSAATGVANGIKAMNNAAGNVDAIPDVVGAIIYDVGGRRYSRITPDDRLGQSALQAATVGTFPLGPRGAGRFAMQGSYYLRGTSADRFAEWAHSGQGGAFRTIGPTKIGVFTVVNALGAIVDRSGRMVRCQRNAVASPCPAIVDKLKSFAPIAPTPNPAEGAPTNNTTLTLVVTNQKLPFWALQRMAAQVHGSMNRAIQPFATAADGDVLVAVTTDEVDNATLSATDLGVVASELAWDAVLRSVPELPPPPALLNEQPAGEALRRFAGTYVFHGGNELTVRVNADQLTATMKGNGRIYFDAGRTYRLLPAANGDFVINAPAQDVLRFAVTEGRVTGLILNPGPWVVRADVRR
jgi:L-aminopeptidase/D-esterase-like protein